MRHGGRQGRRRGVAGTVGGEARAGAQWRSVADGVAWQGLGWQLTMDVRCERSCRFSAAPCRSQFRTSEQVQDSNEALSFIVMNADVAGKTESSDNITAATPTAPNPPRPHPCVNQRVKPVSRDRDVICDL